VANKFVGFPANKFLLEGETHPMFVSRCIKNPDYLPQTNNGRFIWQIESPNYFISG